MAETQWRHDPDFIRIAHGRQVLVLHREIAPRAAEIIARVGALGRGGEAGAGNRQSGFRFSLAPDADLYLRRSRRGGMMRFVLNDLFVGANPRPLAELDIAVRARKRGVPLAEPMGAAVQWTAPMLYRGFFLTRAAPGMTLWEFIRTDDDPTVRAHVLGEANAAIRKMHECGLRHADLNLHNLFVTTAGESFAVIVLDLDKARLYDTALSPAMRASNFARLARSAHKLDPDGRYLDASALSTLGVRE
ncbi:MAG TPA: lipopolysaccharide kinase InaA family protein [Candidatus Binataceae bacterium]